MKFCWKKFQIYTNFLVNNLTSSKQMMQGGGRSSFKQYCKIWRLILLNIKNMITEFKVYSCVFFHRVHFNNSLQFPTFCLIIYTTYIAYTSLISVKYKRIGLMVESNLYVRILSDILVLIPGFQLIKSLLSL